MGIWAGEFRIPEFVHLGEFWNLCSFGISSLGICAGEFWIPEVWNLGISGFGIWILRVLESVEFRNLSFGNEPHPFYVGGLRPERRKIRHPQTL